MLIQDNPSIGRRTPQAARVLVIVLTGADARALPTAADLLHWRRQNPLAAWAQVAVQSEPAAIIEAVTAACVEMNVDPDQMILIGTGSTGRLALELVLDGHLACAGIVAADVSCATLRSPIVSTATAVRLVARMDTPAQPRGLIDALRAADIDERIMMLSAGARRDAQAIAGATGTFLLELIATISRRAGNGVRSR